MQTAETPSFNSTPASVRPFRVKSAHKWQNAMIGIIIFFGGFVIFEPAPYDMLLMGTLGVWLVLGLRIPRAVLPLLLLFTLFNAGAVLSTFQMSDYKVGLVYVTISYFLALSSVFFAIALSKDEKRFALLFKVYAASAFFSSIIGLLGYFGVSGFGTFTLYSRVAGGFKDPNVFGPFLTAPILYLVYCLLNLPLKRAIIPAGVLMVLLLGLFLAFSRAAWGLTVISLIFFYALLFINEKRVKVRLKYIVLAVIGFVSLLLIFLAIMQIDAISSLFTQRARIIQDYDGGNLGRFERHAAGIQMAIQNPLGIGPLEFPRYYTEDIHNIYLKTLLAYGWIGFVSWLTLMGWTLIAGFKLLFRPRPWQVYLQIAYVVFFGHHIIGFIIDTDRWRHLYLMIGIIWACILLEKKWQAAKAKRNTPVRPVGMKASQEQHFQTARPSLSQHYTSEQS